MHPLNDTVAFFRRRRIFGELVSLARFERYMSSNTIVKRKINLLTERWPLACLLSMAAGNKEVCSPAVFFFF